VSMDRGPGMAASLDAGRPVRIVEEPTLADALAGEIGLENRYTFPLVRDLVDYVVLLSEEQIAEGMVHALLKERIVLEGGGATPLGLLLARPESVPGERIALVCSGDNVEMQVLLALVEQAKV
jgi:threonine dehydratase